MKKILFLFSAALVALTMQASITMSDDLALSGWTVLWNEGDATIEGSKITAKAWCGAQVTSSIDATGYDYLFLEVADHTGNISLKVIYTDDSSDQKTMSAAFNTVALYLSQKAIKAIQIFNATSTDNLPITVNRVYLGKAFRDSEEVSILEGISHELNWSTPLQINASAFANVFVGDMLQVYITTDAEDAYHSVQIALADYTIPAFAQTTESSETESVDLVFYYPIYSQDDVANIQSKGGILLKGQNATCTKVSVIHHDVLWSGTQTTDWNNVPIPASSFSSVSVGDTLNIRLTSAVSGTQILLSTSNYGRFTPHLYSYFNEAPAALPATIKYVLNQSTVDELQANGLLACGASSFTMTDIYVNTATETSTSYNLKVTAGMATLVLPFKVPSLPEGVEAYTLSLRESDHAIMAEQVDVIEADQPVLIVAEARETPYTFESELGGDNNISGKSWWDKDIYAYGILIGNYRPEHNPGKTHAVSEVTYYHYLLQNGAQGPGFYQVGDADCSIDSYRAYLSTTYNKAGDSASPAQERRMRLVFPEKAPTGISDVQENVQSTKIMRDGQLVIIRDNKMYNALGQQL